MKKIIMTVLLLCIGTEGRCQIKFDSTTLEYYGVVIKKKSTDFVLSWFREDTCGSFGAFIFRTPSGDSTADVFKLISSDGTKSAVLKTLYSPFSGYKIYRPDSFSTIGECEFRFILKNSKNGNMSEGVYDARDESWFFGPRKER